MNTETTMQLSYQPTDVAGQDKAIWHEKPCYCAPTIQMEENTTYNTRFFKISILLLTRINNADACVRLTCVL